MPLTLIGVKTGGKYKRWYIIARQSVSVDSINIVFYNREEHKMNFYRNFRKAPLFNKQYVVVIGVAKSR
jgi:hypothetical protein